MEISLSTYAQSFIDIISNRYLLLFILSMMPITELRLTIPIGIVLFQLNALLVFIICVAANILIGIILIYSLAFLIERFRGYSAVNFLLDKIVLRSKDKLDKYQYYKKYSLLFFVGVPLPGTGAWTGSLLSHILSLDKSSSSVSIVLGVLLSGVIMTALSITGNIILG